MRKHFSRIVKILTVALAIGALNLTPAAVNDSPTKGMAKNRRVEIGV